jgi:tetratricopeptide (TPR) repeat protein
VPYNNLTLHRYLFETGELDDALSILDIAYDMCTDKTTLVYAHLCNSAAVIFFEMNELKKCQEMNDIAYSIRSKLLPENDLDLANCYHNLGQLAGSRGDYDASMAYLAKAEKARISAGEEAIISLGLGHLIYGRAQFNKMEYQGATERYGLAEKIFARTLGVRSQLYAQYVSSSLVLRDGLH